MNAPPNPNLLTSRGTESFRVTCSRCMRDLEPTLHARGPKESGRQLPWYTYGKTYGPFVLEVLPLPIGA